MNNLACDSFLSKFENKTIIPNLIKSLRDVKKNAYNLKTMIK